MMKIIDALAECRVPGLAVYRRLADALIDPARRNRTMALVALGYALVWTLFAIVSHSSIGLNADMAEMVVWAREPALGYPKHPPLLAWVIAAWFSVFPITDWAFYLLAGLNLGLGLYLSWMLAGEWLDGPKRAIAPLMLALIPFYNHLGLKFDQNSALIPLWALTTLALVRALETRRPGWSALAGLFAALAMLVKYWTAFLLVALALAVLFDRRRNAYLRSSAPWVTVIVGAAVLAPHVYWLVREGFPPLVWIGLRGWGTLRTIAVSYTEYTFGTLGYAAFAVIPALIVVRPSWRGIRDGIAPHHPDRRTAAIIFWATLLVPLVVSVITRTQPLSLWNTAALALLPVMLVGSPLVTVTRDHVARIAAVAVVLMIVPLIASPYLAYRLLQTGGENDAAHARPMAAALQREWRMTSDRPLKLIAGPYAQAVRAAFYAPDRPSAMADFSTYLAPWATPARIARDGVAVVVPAERADWRGVMDRFLAGKPVARRTEVTLTPRWLGYTGQSRRYLIAIVPPTQ